MYNFSNKSCVISYRFWGIGYSVGDVAPGKC